MNRFVAFLVLTFSLCQGVAANAQSSTPVQAAPGSQVLSQTAVTPITIKLEPISPLKLDSGNGAPWWSYFVPIVGPIVSGALAFIGVWLGLGIASKNTTSTTEAAQKNNDAAIWQKANETELKNLQEKLNEFYIPFQLLSDANHLLAQDLRSRQKMENYRLLIQLFDHDWRDGLTPGDRKLVEIICKNAEELRALIASKSGLVDEKILPYLSRVSVHFRMLYLAYKSKLGEDSERFKEYIYPRELDKVLALEVVRLRGRMESLRLNPSGRPGSFESLAIPPDLELPKWSDTDGRLLV